MDKGKGDEQVWPPAPAVPLEEPRAVPTRRSLTGVKGIDIVLGIIAGLTFQWFASYGACMGLYYLIIFYYRIPKPPNCWHFVTGCVIALAALLLTWSRLRLFYPTLANSLLWAGLVFGSFLLWFAYVIASGP